MDKLLTLITLAGICIYSGCSTPERKRDNPAEASLFERLDPERSGITFSNVIDENTQQNFLTYPYYYNGGGVAAGDINNDGKIDLYFTGNMEGDRLYFQREDLEFEDVTRKAGIVSQNLWTTGVAMADINNDGWLDIYVCRSGPRNFRHNILYINQQDGTFAEQSKAWGLNDNGYSIQSYFLDYDLDGDLDMFLINHSSSFFASQEQLFTKLQHPGPEESNKLYRNEGAGKPFTDVTPETGIVHFGFSLSAMTGDINRDGYPDIYVANDFFEPDRLYINQKNGTFKDEIDRYMKHLPLSSMGSDMADVNEDGWPDLFVCDMKAASHYRRHANMVGMSQGIFDRLENEGFIPQYMQNVLYLSHGMVPVSEREQGLFFSDISVQTGTDQTDWSWGALWLDMDNDTHKDLFISNGIKRDIQYKDILEEMGQKVSLNGRGNILDMISTFPVERIANVAFQQLNELEFRDVSEEWGLAWKGFSTGAAYADLDNDGDLDLVLNNLDDTASIFLNHTSQQLNNHYVKIRLVGDVDNSYGIGSKIEVQLDSQILHREMLTSRGYQSSVPPEVHIGLGGHDQIHEISVFWPNGQHSRLKFPKADQRYTIYQSEAFEKLKEREIDPRKKYSWEEIQLPSDTEMIHIENDFRDFQQERLLPYRYSRLGPALAAGDVNGDGLIDIFLGGAKGYSGKILLRNTKNQFQKLKVADLERDAMYEDTDAVWVDVDGDEDLDLYVVSGGIEEEAGSEYYQDRLYINSGDGNFMRDRDALPQMYTSGSCIRPCDFDQDGDVDLFVAGRIVPGKYGKAPRSYLLEKSGEMWVDVTESLSPELMYPGMITDARWIDIDNDHDEDLILVGEWMGVLVMKNENGKLVRSIDSLLSNEWDLSTLDELTGWWQQLLCTDMDNDGDYDLLLGNMGLNYPYAPQKGSPLELFAGDLDGNGSWEGILAYHEQGKLYPVKGRHWIAEQLPDIRKIFTNYTSFAKADMKELLDGLSEDPQVHLTASTFQTVWLEHLEPGKWALRSLPNRVQFSVTNSILEFQPREAQTKELILGGNLYDMDIELARSDGSSGLCLQRTPQGEYKTVLSAESGLHIPGNIRKMALLKDQPDDILLLVAQNNAGLQVFQRTKQLP